MKKSTQIFAISCLLLATGIGAGALLYAPKPSPEIVTSGTALVGGPFEVTDHTGKRVTDKDFLGKYTIYFFGYTYCPDICPTELQVLSVALNDVEDAKDKFNLVFVTVDPERDTPDVMKDYVANFWSGTVGLTGSAEDIRKMAGAYRVYYAKASGPEANTDSYLMDHSSIAYLMGPDGKFFRHFPYGTSAADITKALKQAANS